MQSKVVRMLALALVLIGVGMAMGQENLQRGEEKLPTARKKIRVEEETDVLGPDHPAVKGKAQQKKSKLEDMLAEALKNNADIRVAVAKLAEAEAELNRTRVQVTQQVAMLHHAIVSQKATVEHEQKRYERMKTLSKQGSIDLTLLDEGLLKLTAAKAKLAELEAQVPGLLGKVQMATEWKVSVPRFKYSLETEPGSPPTRAAFSPDGKRLVWELDTDKPIIRHRTMGPMAEKIRKALDRSISVTFENQSIAEIATFLSSDSGLVIKLREEPGVPVREKLTVRGDNLPFGAVLQLLEDSLPPYTIVVRDYGLLITHRQTVPPGAISVQEFLRQKPAEK